MWTNVKYILLTALRDRLFVGLIAAVVLAALISGELGYTALVEELEMTLSYAAATSRLILIVGITIFTCFHIRNAFDTKEIDVILSRPISRQNLVLSYWMGFSVVATFLVLPTVGIIGLLGVLSYDGYLGWAISLLLESWLVVALSMFAAFTLKSAVSSVMASLGVYVLSRMIGLFLATSESGMLFREENVNIVIKFVIDIVSIIMPRIDFFAKTEWLVYGITNLQDWWQFGMQALIFIPLLLFAAMIDFARKQF
jgi:ABC-type transport system involved in multi-copper enzyme maturation permease subunit